MQYKLLLFKCLPITWLSISDDRLFRDAGWGVMVISSLILNGCFNIDAPPLGAAKLLRLLLLPLLLLDVLADFVLLSLDFFVTVLWAEYTWFSNCLYMPNVAVHTVHLYDKWAGFKVIPCSRDTWFNNFHWYICTLNCMKQIEHFNIDLLKIKKNKVQITIQYRNEIAYPSTDWTSASIFTFIGCFLHWTCY